MRLNDWKTKPIRSRRSRVRWRSFISVTFSSPMNTAPEVMSSNPARQCMRVDLPDPDGPMIAVNPPAANATVTSSRARTSVSPDP